jgi:hypothetical protein
MPASDGDCWLGRSDSKTGGGVKVHGCKVQRARQQSRLTASELNLPGRGLGVVKWYDKQPLVLSIHDER